MPIQNHFILIRKISKKQVVQEKNEFGDLKLEICMLWQLRFLCLCVVAVMCNFCLALTIFIFVCLSWSVYYVPGISFSFFFLYFTFLPFAFTSLSVLTLLDLSNLSGQHSATTPFAGANAPLVQSGSLWMATIWH